MVELHVRPDEVGDPVDESRIGEHAIEERGVELNVVDAEQRSWPIIDKLGRRPAALGSPLICLGSSHVESGAADRAF